jgi:hypothetical protein
MELPSSTNNTSLENEDFLIPFETERIQQAEKAFREKLYPFTRPVSGAAIMQYLENRTYLGYADSEMEKYNQELKKKIDNFSPKQTTADEWIGKKYVVENELEIDFDDIELYVTWTSSSKFWKVLLKLNNS